MYKNELKNKVSVAVCDCYKNPFHAFTVLKTKKALNQCHVKKKQKKPKEKHKVKETICLLYNCMYLFICVLVPFLGLFALYINAQQKASIQYNLYKLQFYITQSPFFFFAETALQTVRADAMQTIPNKTQLAAATTTIKNIFENKEFIYTQKKLSHTNNYKKNITNHF